jgi:hypothetical protein
MPTIAQYQTSYLLPTSATAMDAGDRAQLAGPVYALADQFARGASAANALAAVNTKRTNRILTRSAFLAAPTTGGMAAVITDFQGITGP